jgi:hypothetical protein
MLVLCGAYARRPVCFGGGCQDVHAAVAMFKETQAHFQGWSRAMSRTRDQQKAEVCPPRELENALFCYDEQITRAVSFFSFAIRCWLLIGLGALLREACTLSSKPSYQGSVQSQASSHKLSRVAIAV